MYYKLEWNEENTNHFQRVFRAKDVPTLWKAVHYINQERIEKQRPEMKKIRITVIKEYNGDCSTITGAYVKDLLLDAIDWDFKKQL